VSHTVMVRASDLEKLPASVRRYFDDWGRPNTILGIEVVAVDMMTNFDFEDHRRKHQGRGPGHTVDNHAYRVGEDSINDWIRKHPKLVESIYGAEERREDSYRWAYPTFDLDDARTWRPTCCARCGVLPDVTRRGLGLDGWGP